MGKLSRREAAHESLAAGRTARLVWRSISVHDRGRGVLSVGEGLGVLRLVADGALLHPLLCTGPLLASKKNIAPENWPRDVAAWIGAGFRSVEARRESRRRSE